MPAFGNVPDASFAKAHDGGRAASALSPTQSNLANASECRFQLDAILFFGDSLISEPADGLELPCGCGSGKREAGFKNLGDTKPHLAFRPRGSHRDREAQLDHVPAAPRNGKRVRIRPRHRLRRLAVDRRAFEPHFHQRQFQERFSIVERMNDESGIESCEPIFQPPLIRGRSDDERRLGRASSCVEAIEGDARDDDGLSRRLGTGDNESDIARRRRLSASRQNGNQRENQGDGNPGSTRGNDNLAREARTSTPRDDDRRGTQERRQERRKGHSFPRRWTHPIGRAREDHDRE